MKNKWNHWRLKVLKKNHLHLIFDLESEEINVPGVKINTSIEKLDYIKLEGTTYKKQNNWNEEISCINDNIFEIEAIQINGQIQKSRNDIENENSLMLKGKNKYPFKL